MKSQRLDMIEEYVLECKKVSLDTLCEKFNVSKNTIRRDIDILLKRGNIIKVYGGVAALEIPRALSSVRRISASTRLQVTKFPTVSSMIFGIFIS